MFEICLNLGNPYEVFLAFAMLIVVTLGPSVITEVLLANEARIGPLFQLHICFVQFTLAVIVEILLEDRHPTLAGHTHLPGGDVLFSFVHGLSRLTFFRTAVHVLHVVHRLTDQAAFWACSELFAPTKLIGLISRVHFGESPPLDLETLYPVIKFFLEGPVVLFRVGECGVFLHLTFYDVLSCFSLS